MGQTKNMEYLTASGLARPQLLPRPAQLPFEGADLHPKHVGPDLLPREGSVTLEGGLIKAERKKNTHTHTDKQTCTMRLTRFAGNVVGAVQASTDKEIRAISPDVPFAPKS